MKEGGRLATTFVGGLQMDEMNNSNIALRAHTLQLPQEIREARKRKFVFRVINYYYYYYSLECRTRLGSRHFTEERD